MANWFPVGKKNAKTTYTSKAACEAAEGQACYDITGKDLRWHEVSGDELVEVAGKKASAEKIEALAAENSAKILSGVDLLKLVMSTEETLEELILARTSAMILKAGSHTTVGGSSTEEIAVSKACGNKRAFVVMQEVGAVPVTVVSAKCEFGKIVVTFSGDPSNDHKINYLLIK